MWGRVTYEQFLEAFQDKQELSLVQLQKALNWNIADKTLKKFGGIAQEQKIMQVEKRIVKGSKRSRQIIFRKVG